MVTQLRGPPFCRLSFSLYWYTLMMEHQSGTRVEQKLAIRILLSRFGDTTQSHILSRYTCSTYQIIGPPGCVSIWIALQKSRGIVDVVRNELLMLQINNSIHQGLIFCERPSEMRRGRKSRSILSPPTPSHTPGSSGASRAQETRRADLTAQPF